MSKPGQMAGLPPDYSTDSLSLAVDLEHIIGDAAGPFTLVEVTMYAGEARIIIDALHAAHTAELVRCDPDVT
jgi:hypothetical protein